VQAALQSKREDFREALSESFRVLFEQQQEQQQQQQEEDMPAPLWVHHGFLEAYGSVRAETLRLLETAVAGG
jgi:hypothetical protein